MARVKSVAHMVRNIKHKRATIALFEAVIAPFRYVISEAAAKKHKQMKLACAVLRGIVHEKEARAREIVREFGDANRKIEELQEKKTAFISRADKLSELLAKAEQIYAGKAAKFGLGRALIDNIIAGIWHLVPPSARTSTELQTVKYFVALYGETSMFRKKITQAKILLKHYAGYEQKKAQLAEQKDMIESSKKCIAVMRERARQIDRQQIELCREMGRKIFEQSGVRETIRDFKGHINLLGGIQYVSALTISRERMVHDERYVQAFTTAGNFPAAVRAMNALSEQSLGLGEQSLGLGWE